MVSVVIATYRREKSLYNALESLTKQTFKDFEVVIVDDNADDKWNNKVENIVKKFSDKITINYIQNKPNQGSAKSRNIGINEAKGEYITFLDDDDLYLPEKIENQVQIMEMNQADFSLTNLALYNEDESLSEIRKRFYLRGKEKDNLLLCHLKYHMTGTDTMMFKTSYIKSFGGFEPIDVGDEFYLMMKAINNKGKFIYADFCDVKAYVHTGDGGLSSGKGKIDGENKLFEYKKLFFPKIKNKDKRYIKMRHHAVLAFAYKRSGYNGKFISEGVKAGFIAPFQCVRLIGNLK